MPRAIIAISNSISPPSPVASSSPRLWSRTVKRRLLSVAFPKTVLLVSCLFCGVYNARRLCEVMTMHHYSHHLVDHLVDRHHYLSSGLGWMSTDHEQEAELPRCHGSPDQNEILTMMAESSWSFPLLDDASKSMVGRSKKLRTTTNTNATRASSEYEQRLVHLEKRIGNKLKGTIIRSCRRNHDECLRYQYLNEQGQYEPSSETQHRVLLLLYNPLNRPRLVCGVPIGPKLVVWIDPNATRDATAMDCWRKGIETQSRLLASTPTIDTLDSIPPVEIIRSDGIRPTQRFHDCDVRCLHNDFAGPVYELKSIYGTNWKFLTSMEGPQYYPQLTIDAEAHLRDLFYATTSFQSEIPMPYFSWAEYNLQSSPSGVPYGTAIKGALFMARNCGSANQRETVVQELIQYLHPHRLRVESLSDCLHNAPFPPGTNRLSSSKADIMSKYLFYLAFENQNQDDYITEKLWGALEAGTVPVYLGGRVESHHIPPHSVIFVRDFDTTTALADYLVNVANDEALYESYQAWRTLPLPPAFVQRYNFTHTHSTCRLCRWVVAKQYGLGWDPEQQTIQDTAISRRVCFNTKNQRPGLLTWPFRESWLSFSSSGNNTVVEKANKNNADKGGEVCFRGADLDTANSTIYVPGTALERTILSRDGIVDIFLLPTGGTVESNGAGKDNQRVVLQMATTLITSNNSSILTLKKKSKQACWLQDSRLRVVILTSHEGVNMDTTCSNEGGGRGVIRMILPHDHGVPIRIRFIVEDINQFYERGKHESSYFGEKMTEDFFKPVETFSLRLSPSASRSLDLATVVQSSGMMRLVSPELPQQVNPADKRKKAVSTASNLFDAFFRNWIDAATQ